MPRISPEARSAAAYRAGGERRQPRPGMTAAAKELWRAIVADRPVDYFRPGSFEMLEDFCQVCVESRRLLKDLAGLPIDGGYGEPQALFARNSGLMLAYATKLRLSVQADAEWHSRKTDERGDISTRSHLIGGAAGKPRLEFELTLALIESGHLTEAQALDRYQVEAAGAKVLDTWARHWLAHHK